MFFPRFNIRANRFFFCLFLSLLIPLLWYVTDPIMVIQTAYPSDNQIEFRSPVSVATATESGRRSTEAAASARSSNDSVWPSQQDTSKQSAGESTSSDDALIGAVDNDEKTEVDERFSAEETSAMTDKAQRATPTKEETEKSALAQSSSDEEMMEKELEHQIDEDDEVLRVNHTAYECSPEPRNDIRIPEEGTYQPIVNNTTWLMSAHVDHRYHGVLLIRVFGLSSQISASTRNPNLKLYCQMWSADRHLLAVALSKMEKLHLFGFRIESFQMECVFKRDLYREKNAILSLTTKPCQKPNNAVVITDNQRPVRKAVNYTVCISGPTKYNYSDYQRLIEWMELNSILGAGRTIIYDVDACQLVRLVFDYYKRRGELEVYKVNPPYVYGDQRWIFNKHQDPAFAKMSMRHDCIMREMFKTKYIAFLDLDENIVPRLSTDMTWDDMILSAGCEEDSFIVARNVLFRRDWGVDHLAKKDPEVSVTYRLLSLMTTYRDSTFFPSLFRSKYLVRPEHVVAASTHRALMPHGTLPCILPTQVGASHHYKYREVKNNETLPVRDRTIYKYRDLLLERVARTYNDLRKELELFDIFV